MNTEYSDIELVKQDGYNLQKLSVDRRTKNVCKAALEQNGLAAFFVPVQLMIDDEELPLTAVKQNGDSLYYIADEAMTNRVCLTALKQSINAYQYIPNDIKERLDHALPNQC